MSNTRFSTSKTNTASRQVLSLMKNKSSSFLVIVTEENYSAIALVILFYGCEPKINVQFYFRLACEKSAVLNRSSLKLRKFVLQNKPNRTVHICCVYFQIINLQCVSLNSFWPAVSNLSMNLTLISMNPIPK